MSDFSDNYLQRHPNLFGLPQLHIDPSLAPAPPVGGPNLMPGPGVVGGGSPSSMFNLFSHYTDRPLTPDTTLGYGARVGDPSSFNFNLGQGPLVPTVGADQTGQVSAGVNLPTGTSVGAAVNPQGVVQGQVGQNIPLGGQAGQLNLQGNASSDGSVGGSVAWQRGDLRVGVNGSGNPSTGEGNVGGGVSVRF
jgi:hypothetical protein